MPIARQLIIGKACVFGTTPLRTQHLRRSKLRPCLPGFNRTRFTQTILQEDIGNHHVQQKRHTLPDGTKLEVLEKLAGKVLHVWRLLIVLIRHFLLIEPHAVGSQLLQTPLSHVAWLWPCSLVL